MKKIANLCEIALLPGGLSLKLRHRNFHWREYRMCVRLRQAGVAPATILDVGANEGQFAIGALAAFPTAHIHCFEPGAAARERLIYKIGKNPRVRIHPLALGRAAGEASLRVTSQDQSSSFLPLHENHLRIYPEVQEVRNERVRISNLASEWERMAPIQPVFLKIDTQGFEMNVLAGAEPVLPKIRWIALEASAQPMYEGETLFQDLLPWLRARGFEFRGPLEIHFTPQGYPAQFDALFERASGSPAADF